MKNQNESQSKKLTEELAISRRSVFAAVGSLMLGAPAAKLASVMPLLTYDQWVTCYRSDVAGYTELSQYWVESKEYPNRGYKVWVRIVLSCFTSGKIVDWTTYEDFYDNGVWKAKIPPNWDSQLAPATIYNPSNGQGVSFMVYGGGNHRITKRSTEFKHTTTTSNSFDFIISIPFLIVSSAGTGGSISTVGKVYVNPGGSKTYSFTPDKGYRVSKITVDGKTVTNAKSYPFNNVQADHTIHVDFEPIPKHKVHIMLNDEKGDAVELFTKEMTTGSKLSTSDEAFGSAMEELGKLYEREVCELADRWYEGDEYGATNWGKKFKSKKVNGETWIWVRIGHYRVRCYSDGTDSDKIVFEEKHIPVGRKFTIPQEAYDAAKKADCNLNAHFGTQSASGFTGWFRDKALTEPAPATLTTDKPGVIPLYARNRATLRAAYANGSALPEDGADYRTAPSDDAPAYPRAMRLPSFDEEPAHRLDGVELPATGDWADQHCLGYRGEVLTLPGYATVYQRLGDGRWRTFRAQGWTDDPDGAAGAGGAVRKSRSLTALRLAASPSSARVQVEADATRYIRWVESTVDGVETSE